MRRILLLLICLLVPATVAAQTVPGTFTWTHTRPSDLQKYTIQVDGGAVTDLGIPVANSTPLSLTVGSHTVILSACYTDTTCLPATTSVTVTLSTPLAYTNLLPTSPLSITNAVANGPGVTLQVDATDNSGISLVKLHWFWNGNDNQYATTKVGNTYSATVRPTSGPGTRTWYFEIRATDGEIAVTPTRTVNVTP